jgi:hypothetical protein
LTATVGTLPSEATAVVAEAAHPFELVMVTVYDPAEATEIEGVVSPVLHKYVGFMALPTVAVNIPLG